MSALRPTEAIVKILKQSGTVLRRADLWDAVKKDTEAAPLFKSKTYLKNIVRWLHNHDRVSTQRIDKRKYGFKVPEEVKKQ